MRKSELQTSKGHGLKGARGALSAAWRLWQSPWVLGMVLVAATAPAHADQTGGITVMKQGNYWCETPGNALGKAGIHQPDQDFSIRHASIYSFGAATGIYLLTGDVLRFTTGPRKGNAFRRVSENFLRKLDAQGQDTNVRCIRSVLNNQEIGEPGDAAAPAKPVTRR